ncbi:hypothetical protein CJD36_021390 [Flavipsychrobacter stenotrophus]|uniref:Uncharacterized protein n=2 Tax=Flavipsychrobacter stenotrophus TaxID=2077091 RepID=A0A2S7SQX3_9BACT|nr:hypothetical protein CJD36_021390 [Flavipsychrobacter stenotrophus]
MLTTISGYSQVYKFRAFERTIYEPSGSKEITKVSTLISVDFNENKIVAYIGDNAMHVDIIKYLQTIDKAEGTEMNMIGVDDSNVKVNIKLMLFNGTSEAGIIFDYEGIKGGWICYSMKDTR